MIDLPPQHLFHWHMGIHFVDDLSSVFHIYHKCVVFFLGAELLTQFAAHFAEPDFAWWLSKKNALL